MLLGLLTACARDAAPRAGARDPAAGAPPEAPSAGALDSATVSAAREALALFLSHSREGAAPAPSDSAAACPVPNDVTAPGPMLAAYDILPPAARGDTIVGRAVVTTVADQDVDRRHPGFFVARLRVRSDTLEWDVLRGDDGRWMVCNGLRFGLTAPESLTTWRPAGASREAARALADSIASRAEAARP